MKDLDCENEIEFLLHFGEINHYGARKLAEICSKELDEDLWDSAIKTYREYSAAGVSNDRDARIFFYVDLFADDLLEKAMGIRLDQAELDDFKRFVFEHRIKIFGNRDDLNLADMALMGGAIQMWTSGDLEKSAHPNIGRSYIRSKSYNLDAWAQLYSRARELVRGGMVKGEALRRVAYQLNVPERYNFLMWAEAHADGEYKKYDINSKLREMNQMPNKIASDGQFYYIPKTMSRYESKPEVELTARDMERDEQYAVDFESARNKLMSRVFAIDKLLEKYRKVIKPEQMDSVEEALTELRKRVRRLKLAASVRDSMIKTAGILRKLDFDQGADDLMALAADDEISGATKVVEKDLGVVNPEEREAGLDAAISKLTDISSVLKNRDLVRSLAEVDLMLHKLRMSSFFPEIQEAQSKLIDSFGYASNKLEDLLPKLRGGLKVQPEIVNAPEVAPKPAAKNLGDEVADMVEAAKPAPAEPVAPTIPPAPLAPKAPQPQEEPDEPANLRKVRGIE